ncbi:hypothetical protein BDZ89DRAFT_1140766 [Hymenopellis radicata]|nr:hypothetical protein BDZ89DRAFT_1140766 [Hymenopellis radicata]
MFSGFVGNRDRCSDILRDLEGLVKVGEMLVVLGGLDGWLPTLLKSIAGETHGFFVEKDAHINYQGILLETMHKDFRGEVIYKAQTDVTLLLARPYLCSPRSYTSHPSPWRHARYVFRPHARRCHGRRRIEPHPQIKVGNDFVRGVSDGDRRRISIAEAARPLSLLRQLNPWSGQRDCSRVRQDNSFVHQSYGLWPCTRRLRTFTTCVTFIPGMGFECPPRQTTADFLTSFTSPAERQIRPGFEAKVRRTPDEFVRAWKEREDRKRLFQQIDDFDREFPVGGGRPTKASRMDDPGEGRVIQIKSPYIDAYAGPPLFNAWFPATEG